MSGGRRPSRGYVHLPRSSSSGGRSGRVVMFFDAVCQKLVEIVAAPAAHGAVALQAPRQIFATSSMVSGHKRCRKLYFQITGDTLPPFLNSMRNFYKEGLPLAIDWDAGRVGINTAILCQYHNNGNPKPVDLGYKSRGIHGCTTLLVVSRKAVYATHWWENVSCATDDDQRGKKRGGILETDDEVFTRTVLNPLRKGMTKRGVLHHPEIPRSIGDPHVKAYLIRPQRCSDGTLNRYRGQWDKIRVTVAERVPDLQDMSRWAEIVYRPLNKGDRKLRTGWHGRILFKYHPPSEGRDCHTAKLWVENEPLPYHDDIWQ
ncbi:hypothetical protein GE09DRAFT_518261 [Coniochaeta sp. 2T2.1]|nr:hypothetical protein GE09DRAFT_518261 [Coniochaeta sp. 2T2.1]